MSSTADQEGVSELDKGGDAEKFRNIQLAYEVLSDAEKRAQYDATGKIVKSVEEDFMDSFAGGSFRDKVRTGELEKMNISEQITVRQDAAQTQSHTAGFEAWMRSRGQSGMKTFTTDDVVDQFGVVKGTYEAVPLPKIKAYTVRCEGAGAPAKVLTVGTEPIPAELEWGQVLVSVRATPINPADLYTVQTGGVYGQDAVEAPFIAGHDGVGVVVKVGPGVKTLNEQDWVVPMRPNLGMWRSLLVCKEKDLLRIPSDAMPLEQCAMLRELFTAYRLLEDHASLKPGDCVILNGANSTVGQLVVQLCCLLRLRVVAVISKEPDFEKTSLWLKALGAVEVLLDEGSFRVELDKHKFFAKPKLALDCVGGASTLRLSDTLAEGGQLVVFGCMSGRSPQWSWQSWVFQNIQVKGFNIRNWMRDNKKKIGPMLESLGKLVKAGKLQAAYTEYELSTEFTEALEHSMDRGKNTKIVLKLAHVGTQY
ncbi:hypothetical protein N2152v2_010186 [Parachlorella kessleri]